MSKIIVPSHREHRVSGIYLFRNTINGKVYVGQSNDLYMRYHRHKRSVNLSKPNGMILIAAFKKYGFDRFEFSILEFTEKSKLTEREQYWMDFFKSSQKEFGYNACPAAGSAFGYKHSKETRQKVSASLRGRKHSLETKKKISNSHTGKTNSIESREKNRIAHLGRKVLNKRGCLVDKISRITGGVLGTFRSASAAAIETNQKTCSAILETCHGRRISAGGYVWRFHV